MSKIVRINVRRLLTEKLGVRDDIMDASNEVYDILLNKVVDTEEFLDPDDVVYSKDDYGEDNYYVPTKITLSKPIGIGNKISIDRLTVALELEQANMPMYTPFVYYGASAVSNAPYKVNMPGKDVYLGTSPTDDFFITISILSSRNLEEFTPAQKNSFTNFFKENKKVFVRAIAHELKHAFDDSVRPTKVKDTIDYINKAGTSDDYSGTPTSLLSKDFNNFLYYSYRAHKFETSVYLDEVANAIKASNITKKDFLYFLEYDNLYTELTEMEKYKGPMDVLRDVRRAYYVFDSALSNFIQNTKNYTEDVIRDRISSSKDPQYNEIKKALLGLRDKNIEKFTRTLDINRPEDIKNYVQKEVKKINKAGRDMKKKIAKLYGYDELFVDGDQPTKRTTKLPG